MENSCVQLNDLPDEILVIILKKLAKVEVLYSLFDVNKRLNKISHDTVFTNDLPILMSASDDLIYSLPDQILDRFCSYILPKIHEKIEWLHLESRSMERILLATNYPNLYGISLHNIQPKTAINLFTDETSVIATIKNQVLSLTIDISTQGLKYSPLDGNAIILNHIFNMFANLQYLNFGRSSVYDERLFFCIIPSTVFSTNLLELHVCLKSFHDCLYLLNGHFNQLQTLYIDVDLIFSSDIRSISMKKLPTLKCFWLHSDTITSAYDELVVPLLNRMPNLEKLDLYMNVIERKTFFDGNDLKMNIINYMPQLNKFTFNICSLSSFYNEINLPSNEDIQKTFRDFNNKEIIYWADYFPERRKGHCRIYSYPYKWKYYDDITNHFPGKIFIYVRSISLYDERPFEHEFFLRIAESFPLMEELFVRNQKQQINKPIEKSKKLSIIKYPSLKQLFLNNTCIDYHEQFLFDTKTSLPFNVRVNMQYGLVKQVTHNFTSNTTRSNCAKINFANLRKQMKFPEYSDDFSTGKELFRKHIKDYFPHTQID
ncbi:unnamed protein product [Rotaria magnacalcarata]|uniref:F-box domain-containing protein n=2 Tax=Rotaria magnacalcarata TaxID=392030 RepID=A0A816XBA0_9BILA|nr:unnamed protein product [Rotaria magnacalcarata]